MVYLGAAILVAAMVAGAVYYLRRAILTSVALGQRDAALRVSDERVDAMEKAAAAERVERAEEYREEAAEVRTASDAARLLRERFARARKSS